MECVAAAIGSLGISSYITVVAYAAFLFISSSPDGGKSFLTTAKCDNILGILYTACTMVWLLSFKAKIADAESDSCSHIIVQMTANKETTTPTVKKKPKK